MRSAKGKAEMAIAYGTSKDVELLARSRLFAGMDAEELSPLQPHIRHKTFRRGEVIFHKEDLPGDCYFIVNGTVKYRVESADGRELIQGFYAGEGESFGAFDVLHEVRRDTDAVALEPCEMLVISNTDLMRFLTQDPRRLAMALMSYSVILRASFQRLQDFVFLDGRGRLIKTLLQHSLPAPEVGDCARAIRKPLTQSQLAAFTGNSRESVNRWLKSLARQGIVELSKEGVIILQPQALEPYVR